MRGESTRRSWVTNLGLAAATVILTLGAIEVVLREFLPVRGLIYALDDRYLLRQVPGARKLAHPAGEEWPKVLVAINAAGRRGDESALPRAIHRVVVYGDSFIAAEATREAETYPAQLERLLSARFGLTKVLNAGVSGYGVDQESLRIEDELATIKPDLVVVAVYSGNDFGDLLRDKLWRLDNDGQLQRQTPTIDDALKDQFRAAAELSHIQIVRAAQVTYQRWQPPPGPPLEPAGPSDSLSVMLAHRTAEYESYVLHHDNVVRNLLKDEYDADVSLTPDSASARYRVLLMERVLARIHEMVAAHGANLLLLIIPEWCDLSESCDASSSRRAYPGYRPTGLTSAVEGIAERQKIVALNLFNPFRSRGAGGLYYRFDQHWSPQGQQLAAQLSADLVAREGWLRSAAPAPVR